MSINQVINGKNRLVEHPNRYKLNAVSGQANTYDFEKQPGEVTENGTPYAKTILDKIDNVLSYLQPSVEKVQSENFKWVNESLATSVLIESTQHSVTPSTALAMELIYEFDLTDMYYSAFSFDIKSGVEMRTVYFDVRVTYNDGEIENIKSGIGTSSSNWSTVTTSTFIFKSNKIPTKISFYGSYYTNISTPYIRNIRATNINNILYFSQNQFTLDNNGLTFTNNQRVLVETPSGKNKYNLNTGYSISEDGKIATNNNGVVVSTNKYNSSYDLRNIFDLSSSSTWSFNSSSDTETKYLKIDLGNVYQLNEFKTQVSAKPEYYNTKWQYSEDDINYIDLFTYTQSETELTNHNVTGINARYLKATSEKIADGTGEGITYISLQYENITGMSLDGVTSNTINNITCDTLLQPSAKYELKYNETLNKFELDGLMNKPAPLFDITLTEAVNQVDLIGIVDKIKDGKLYELYIGNQDNYIVSTSGNINFGSGDTLYGYTSLIYLFSSGSHNSTSNTFDVNGICSSKTSSGIGTATIHLKYNGALYEYLKCSTASTTFNVGTRIIIKEVC